MKRLILLLCLLSSLLLISCAHTYWNNYDSSLNNPGDFSRDNGYCQMYSSGAVQQQQAINTYQNANTTYNNRTSAALAGTSQAFGNVAVSISSYENCMASKGWYKVQPPTVASETPYNDDGSIHGAQLPEQHLLDPKCLNACWDNGNSTDYCYKKCR